LFNIQKNQENKDTQKWSKFTYILKDTKYITKLFKNLPFNIALTTNNTVGRNLSNKTTYKKQTANWTIAESVDSHVPTVT